MKVYIVFTDHSYYPFIDSIYTDKQAAIVLRDKINEDGQRAASIRVFEVTE